METLKLPSHYVFDKETTVKNKGEGSTGNMAASPHHPDNHTVFHGQVDTVFTSVHIFDNSEIYHLDGVASNYFVGHNLKFDFLYDLKEASTIQNLHHMKFWDTMIVEYLITGQQAKFASLDSLSEKYGGTLKDSKIKDYWDSGMETEDIPEEELKEYLKEDVLNTRLIFLKQYRKVIALGILPLVHAQMDALKATTIMEWHGMHFDIKKAYDQAANVNKDMEEYKGWLEYKLIDEGITDPNPSSNDQISLYIFGGEYYITKDIKQKDKDGNYIRYKTGVKKGEVKTKKEKVAINIPGKIPWSMGEMSSKQGIFKVGDEQLQALLKSIADNELERFIKNLLEYRRLFKDLKTYYIGFAKHFWPHDNKIHGTINHCATDTGRLSSSNPNLQNLSGKDT